MNKRHAEFILEVMLALAMLYETTAVNCYNGVVL